MASKIFLAFCISTTFLQGISAQCIGNPLFADELSLAGLPVGYTGVAASNRNFAANPYGVHYGQTCGYNTNVAPTSGGGFTVTSTSPISPTGIAVTSENVIEGPISMFGELPFLSAVVFDGDVPTTGWAAINYGCGSQPVCITSDIYGASAPGKFGPGTAHAACSPPGLVGSGFGYNGLGPYGPIY